MQILTRAMLSLCALSLLVPFSSAQSLADLEAGKREFEARCGGCHGGDGKGGAQPRLFDALFTRWDAL